MTVGGGGSCGIPTHLSLVLDKQKPPKAAAGGFHGSQLKDCCNPGGGRTEKPTLDAAGWSDSGHERSLTRYVGYIYPTLSLLPLPGVLSLHVVPHLMLSPFYEITHEFDWCLRHVHENGAIH